MENTLQNAFYTLQFTKAISFSYLGKMCFLNAIQLNSHNNDNDLYVVSISAKEEQVGNNHAMLEQISQTFINQTIGLEFLNPLLYHCNLFIFNNGGQKKQGK